MEQTRTYTHLSPEERAVIMLELHRAREDNRPCSIRALARALNRNPSTISRELRRLGDAPYDATLAAIHYRQQRQNCRRQPVLVPGTRLYRYVFDRLVYRHWSPQQITARLRRMPASKRPGLVSHETVYATIYAQPRGELKKALIEAGNIYTELRKMGAKNLKSINLGGGLAIEYSQAKESSSRNYTLKEYANDVVFLLKSIAEDKKEAEPDIFIESGRYVAASHAVLVAPILELFTQEYAEEKLALKKDNPPVVAELYDLYKTLKPSNALEYLHDAMSHMESVLTLFDLGYVDLIDRSNGEILVHLIMRKAYGILGNKQEYSNFLNSLGNAQERYLVNFSIFQSLPDFWGIKQHFPIMPLERLDERATLSASIWDITCDSDGEIEFDNQKNPLFLHDFDPEKEEYFLGFFLVGAYQEVLGMSHNLFAHPTEATVILKDDGGFEIKDFIESQSVIDILEDMDYDVVDIRESLNERVEKSNLIGDKEKKHILGELYLFLNDNSYLKTIK